MKTSAKSIGRFATRALIVLVASFIISLSGSTSAGASSAITPGETAPVQAQGDSTELEQFLDGIVPSQLSQSGAPGITIAVVKDGKLLAAKGYGYADAEKQTPVVADKTLFRIGSVSKLFTWTAVMQLVEQGKLDLNADVNTYLKRFKIPSTYPEPITVKHLMTHTTGFEESENIGNVFLQNASELQPLKEYIATHIPARVRKPGELISYSNYGAGLAAHIVEVVSGIPFEQYVADQIFAPLDMTRSTLQQPLPADLAGDVATGYETRVTSIASARIADEPQPFTYIAASPAGGISSTATDMANFMISHLQNGQFKDRRILQEATARQMHTQQFAFDPRAPGITLGFRENERNSLRLIEHGGVTFTFYSKLTLIPEENMGIFVSVNSMKGDSLRSAVTESVIDHYYPRTSTLTRAIANGSGLERFAGNYRTTRRSYTTLDKYLSLPGTEATVNPDGTLQVEGFKDSSGKLIRWTQVEPLLFRDVNQNEYLAFREDAQGQITMMVRAGDPATYVRQPSYMSRENMLIAQFAPSGLALLTLVIWPVGGLVRRIRRGKGDNRPNARLARYLALTVCLLVLGAIVAITGGTTEIRYRVSPVMMAGLVMGLLAAIGTAGLVILTVLAWRARYWSLIGRIYFTLLALSFLVFTWFLNEWNLLGFRF